MPFGFHMRWSEMRARDRRDVVVAFIFLFAGGFMIGAATGRAQRLGPAALDVATLSMIGVALTVVGAWCYARMLMRQDELVRHMASVVLAISSNIALLVYFLLGWLEALGAIPDVPLLAIVAIWYVALTVTGWAQLRKYRA